tara:strand:+ start:1103 stop:1462 length:360 start_codon:yes stop_codon:yes gene_type:complete
MGLLDFIKEEQVQQGLLQNKNPPLPNRDWITRALDINTPTTEANETVRTASVEKDGLIYLFPTVRMTENGLIKFDGKNGINEAFKISLQNKDFITFDTEEEATDFSKYLSNLIYTTRNK